MIIFGLGNPGLKYRATRHNVGFMLIERIVRAQRKKLSRKREYACGEVILGNSNTKATLIKPLLFMNRSGMVVSKIIGERAEEFLVVVDDVYLPLGRLRLRSKGSDGGHLGLRSIIETIGSGNFYRLRIGVGLPSSIGQDEPGKSLDIAVHVLNPLSQKEKKVLFMAIDKAIIGIEMLLDNGFEKSQNYVNSVDVGKVYRDNRESV